MSSQLVAMHRANVDVVTSNNSRDNVTFDAFNFAPGQDQNIRWLSRPNQKLLDENYPNDLEKFRITFDVENFQPEQIKIYVQNQKLTITGVYEERSGERFTQKQFEKSFDIPKNADVETMASYLTPNHMLVVEIPLCPNLQYRVGGSNHLSVENDSNDKRRLSFSLNKFNALNNDGLLSSTTNVSGLPGKSQQLRRTSITKTTTTTTSTAISPEAAELLRCADIATSTTRSSNNTYTNDRRGSNTVNQQVIINGSAPLSSATTNSKLSDSELANLPIEIPPELLATGGTITIQKRKVSVTKTTDPNVSHVMSVPILNNNGMHSSFLTNTSLQSQLPPSVNNERRGSKTTITSNQRRMFTIEEFLQNKIWNPLILDGMNGKKILYMRLQMKPDTKADQIKIILNGYDLRVEVENKVPSYSGSVINEQSYRHITLFPTCEVDQLKTELKNDGFLHIRVPIQL